MAQPGEVSVIGNCPRADQAVKAQRQSHQAGDARQANRARSEFSAGAPLLGNAGSVSLKADRELHREQTLHASHISRSQNTESGVRSSKLPCTLMTRQTARFPCSLVTNIPSSCSVRS